MTYGRARLWLGISGVGSFVVIAAIALAFGFPLRLSHEQSFGSRELLQLMAVIGFYMVWLAPLDFLGGYWLPNRFQKSEAAFAQWLRGYALAASFQALVFAICGSSIVLLSQSFGVTGGLLAVTSLTAIGWYVRSLLIFSRALLPDDVTGRLSEVVAILDSWRISVPRTIVLERADRGYTGGIIGLGKHVAIVIPKAWLSFRNEELATALARRALAIRTGSYSRGLVLAFGWNLLGFFLASLIPENGVSTVAGLVSAICWFTLWSFMGLLILPTVSRNACLMIDDELVRLGLPPSWVTSTASTMDQLQDDEPQRPRWIEAIFHPVPSVHGRSRPERGRGLAAWNVARTTLLFSWPCLGVLSRSVHCNLGRPELWTMLPTD
jgi:hypothetical protein